MKYIRYLNISSQWIQENKGIWFSLNLRIVQNQRVKMYMCKLVYILNTQGLWVIFAVGFSTAFINL